MSQISRRSLLKCLGGAGTALMLTGSCSSSDRQFGVTSLNSTRQAAATNINTSNVPLRVAFSAEPRQFDPALTTTTEAYQVCYALYEALVWIDAETTVRPLVATSWSVTSDLLAWTFELQRGIKFHNGTELTSQDVVYSLSRLIDPDFGSPIYEVLRVIERIDAVDDYTVHFLLSSPNADFPSLLAAPQAGIIPNQISSAELNRNPIGAGPYRFVEAIPGDRIRMQLNTDYAYAEGYSVEFLEFLYYPSFEAQVDALLSGNVHLIPDFNPLDLSSVSEHPAIEILESPSERYFTIVMQATESPFSDIRVRQALKHCADRPLLLEQVLLGRGSIGYDHPLPSTSTYFADLPLPEYNISKARQLLAEAGYPEGLRLSLITAPARPGMVELAEYFSAMAQPAGIEIRVVQVPADVYWSDYNGKVPFHIGSWNSSSSLDEAFSIAYQSISRYNESHWKNADFDAVVETARVEADFEKRKALYQEAQKILMEDGAVIIPFFRSRLVALQNTIHNYVVHPSGWVELYEVEFNPTPQQ